MEKKLNIFDLQGFEDICNEFNITAGSNNHGICQAGYEENGESNGKLRWNDPSASGGSEYTDPYKRPGIDRGEPGNIPDQYGPYNGSGPSNNSSSASSNGAGGK